jgi:hypothetical protein
MKTLTDLLYAEAARKLDAYLKSGLAGFLQQAIDRLTALDIDCRGISRDRDGALHLREHLRLLGV